MKKTFMLVMTSLTLVVTSLASPTGKIMGEQMDVHIRTRDQQGDIGRPRSMSLFSAYYDTDLNILSVSALYNVGEVNVVIENLTTGEYAEYSFDSSQPEYFPISGNTGFWRITLMLENGALYYGEFVL